MRMLANLNKSLNMPQNVIEVFEFPATSNHSSFCLIYVTLLRACCIPRIGLSLNSLHLLVVFLLQLFLLDSTQRSD